MGQDGLVLFLRRGTRYIKARTCRRQLTSPLRCEHYETQDKQVKAINSQNNREYNIVKLKSSSDEDDNKSYLQMHDTTVGNRKKPSISNSHYKTKSNYKVQRFKWHREYRESY